MMKGYYRTKKYRANKLQIGSVFLLELQIPSKCAWQTKRSTKKENKFHISKRKKWNPNLKILTSTPTETRPSTKTDQCIDAF